MGSILTRSVLSIYISGKVLNLVHLNDTTKFLIDYEETFAPMVKLNSIRVFLSLAINLDWELHQLDVKNAFLNETLNEEVYIKIPPGFQSEKE